MNLPVPQPTPEQRAASEELEGSRAQYNLKRRLELLFIHTPDTVTAARIGEPTLDDPAAVTAPTVVHDFEDDYMAALNNKPAPEHALPGIITPAPVAAEAGGAPAPAAESGSPAPALAAPAPLTLNDVPAAGTSTSPATSGEMTAAPAGGGSTTGLGGEIVDPTEKPAATGAPDPNFGFKPVKPSNSGAAPAVEKPADAPDQVNEVSGKAQPAAEAAKTKPGQKPKDAGDFDKGDESSSKHKPKKGVDKLNPF
jgi:outer membrane protein assembly factor BamD